MGQMAKVMMKGRRKRKRRNIKIVMRDETDLDLEVILLSVIRGHDLPIEEDARRAAQGLGGEDHR